MMDAATLKRRQEAAIRDAREPMAPSQAAARDWNERRDQRDKISVSERARVEAKRMRARRIIRLLWIPPTLLFVHYSIDVVLWANSF